MRNTNKISNKEYTVIQAIDCGRCILKRTNTFKDINMAKHYAWTCVSLLNASWSEVYAPNGKKNKLIRRSLEY